MSAEAIRRAPPSLQIVEQPEAPPLESGDRLSRTVFHRRYAAHPELKKAELVEGVVYVASPVRHRLHGKPHASIMTWIGVYAASTPGVDFSDNATILIDGENEVQPDAIMRLEAEHGGKSVVTPSDYLEGPPELVIEIAASSASYDLYDKKRVYARNGVQEYLAIQVYERKIDWFVLREGVYETLPASDEGVLKSEVFPGLWLQPAAFWAGELAALLAVLQQGLATPEHGAFAEKLRPAAPDAQSAEQA